MTIFSYSNTISGSAVFTPEAIVIPALVFALVSFTHANAFTMVPFGFESYTSVRSIPTAAPSEDSAFTFFPVASMGFPALQT